MPERVRNQESEDELERWSGFSKNAMLFGEAFLPSGDLAGHRLYWRGIRTVYPASFCHRDDILVAIVRMLAMSKSVTDGCRYSKCLDSYAPRRGKRAGKNRNQFENRNRSETPKSLHVIPGHGRSTRIFPVRVADRCGCLQRDPHWTQRTDIPIGLSTFQTSKCPVLPLLRPRKTPRNGTALVSDRRTSML